MEEGEEKGGERRGPRYINCVGSSAENIIRETRWEEGAWRALLCGFSQGCPFQLNDKHLFFFFWFDSIS